MRSSRALLLLPLLLTGCTAKVAVLEARIDHLEAENAELRARLDAVEAQAAETRGKVEQWDRLMEMATGALGSLDGTSSGTTSRPAAMPYDGPTCELLEEGRYRLAGPLLDEELARAARTIPHRDADGAFDGFRLSAIRRGRLGDTCGFKNGDVLHRVNGRSMTTASEAMDAWQAVQSDRELRIDVTRRGRAETWVIERTP